MSGLPIHPASQCDGIEQMNFCAYFGQTFRKRLTWSTLQSGVKTPKSLATVTEIIATFRWPTIDSATERVLTLGAGVTIINAAGGIFELLIDPDEFTVQRNELYDIGFVFSDEGRIAFPMVGVIRVLPFMSVAP